MPDYRAEARRAAERYGLDPDIFSRQIQQESGFNPKARSGAGAIGIAQIMPATARGWGVDPTDPIASLNAAAKNMARYVQQFGSYRNALVAYNAGPDRVGKPLFAETANYIKTILGGSNPKGLASPQGSSGNTTGAAPASSGSGPEAAPLLGDPGRAADVTSLLQSLLSRPVQTPQSQPVAPPSFAASPVLPNGVQLAQPQAPAEQQQPGGVDDALSLLGSLQGSDPTPGGSVPGGADSGAQEPVAVTVRNQRAAAKSMGLSGSKILELIYNNGGQGYGIKNGQDVNGPQTFAGVWAGHANHVHVAAGPKTTVALGRYAQKLGLHVGENPSFGGVDPVHVQGSYHYKGEAIDVSGDAARMEQFARAVEQYNRTRRLPEIT